MKRTAFILFLGCFLFFALYRLSLSPPQRKAEAQIFVIPRGANGKEIAQSLKKAGLIRSAFAFRLLLKEKGLERKIRAGDFLLSATMSAYQIAQHLLSPLDIWVTIPEGWRTEEIGEYLEEKLGRENSKFKLRKFLEKAKPLEGFLFPDTYLIPKNASAERVIQIMKDNFFRRVGEDLFLEIEKRGWTLREVVILASIVEREVKFKEDRPIVAGILIKRLKKGMPLQADATVQYAKTNLKLKTENSKLESWWSKDLTKADLELNSPYNTRKFPGLPPGPICNPGLAAIKAVVFPKETVYWYYLSDQRGRMHYASTLEEHNQNIVKFLK